MLNEGRESDRRSTHIGARTTHHGQSMYPVSLSPMNRMPSIPKNPMPPERALPSFDAMRNLPIREQPLAGLLA